MKKVGDQYILYYSLSSSGSQNSAIGYATSSTMEAGSWTDHGSTGIVSTSANDYNAIDPTLFLDPNTNKYYMSYGSYWDGIFVVQMTDDATSIASGATPVNIAYQPAGSHRFEGSNIIYKNGYYYLFWSSGRGGQYDTDLPADGEEYRVLMGRSTAVTGPYYGPAGYACMEGNGGALLVSHDDVYGPGGQGFLLDDPSYGDLIYYHYGKLLLLPLQNLVGIPCGRFLLTSTLANKSYSLVKDDYQFGWNKITWTDGWPALTA